MVGTAIILHITGAVLGAWSATLLWRLVLARLERRRLRSRPGSTPAISFTLAQRRRGLAAVCVCLPASIACIVLGERLMGDGVGSYGLADAIIVACASLVLVLAAGAACAGWFFDPARGRRRCPSCWYELAGIDPGACPECGRRGLAPHHLFRTRRSRRLLTVASILLMVAGSLFFVRLARLGRASVFVPTGVMITALPWLPQAMLSGDESSLGDRVREGDLSDSQRRRLCASCRSVIETSIDLEQIERVAWFYLSYARDAQAPPRMQQAAAASLIRDMVSFDPAISRIADQRWNLLSRHMPDVLTPEYAQALLPILRAAMTSKDPIASWRAFDLAPWLGKTALPLLPLAYQRSQSAGVDPRAGGSGVALIAALAPYSEDAWKSLLQIARNGFGTPAAPTLPEEGAAQLGAHMDVMEAKLLAALDDDSDEIAAWAGRVLLSPDAGPARERNLDRLVQVMKSRPPVGTGALQALRLAVRADDRLIEVMVAMLASQDPLAEDAAAQMCLSLRTPTPGADRLLPALRRLRDARARNVRGGQSSVELAIDRLEREAAPPE